MRDIKIKSGSPAYKAAYMGVLSACAIALGYLEGLLPPMPFMPPGAKLGLSNIAVMLASKRFGFLYAVAIAAAKAGFAGLTRGTTAFFMSLAGGVLSAAAVSALFKLKNNPFGFIGLGIISAIAHNAGQLGVASVLLGRGAVLAYAPYLFVFSIVTGAVTGTALKIILPATLRLEENKT